MEILILDMKGNPEGHLIQEYVNPLIVEEVERGRSIFDAVQDLIRKVNPQGDCVGKGVDPLLGYG